jgi:integrase-like protein
VRHAAAEAGITKLAPHDLRRTRARLCHLAGGELDQIQFLLGHVSIQTTERYLGCKQKLRNAVNDIWVSNPMPPERRQDGFQIRPARLIATRVGLARVVLPLRPRSQMADKRRNRDDPVAVARHGWRYQTSRHPTLVAARWQAVSRSICVVWAETAPNAVSAHSATAARCLTDPSSSVRIDRARAEALPPTP